MMPEFGPSNHLKKPGVGTKAQDHNANVGEAETGGLLGITGRPA